MSDVILGVLFVARFFLEVANFFHDVFRTDDHEDGQYDKAAIAAK